MYPAPPVTSQVVCDMACTLDPVAPGAAPYWLAVTEDIDAWRRRTAAAIAAGEADAVADGLAFLEADPFTYRSGYARNARALRLAAASLTEQGRARARSVVLSTVDGERHCPQPGIGRLARSVADNALRRALRRRLHSPDPAVAHRALRVLAVVRRPGLTAADRGRAQDLVLDSAGRWPSLMPSAARLARWLWTPEWAAQLRSTAVHHGPHRAAARRLVARWGRPGP
jgi:hypothetical protein